MYIRLREAHNFIGWYWKKFLTKLIYLTIRDCDMRIQLLSRFRTKLQN